MKRKYELTALMFGLVIVLISFIPSSARAQYDDVSLETFYEELSPYGVWIDDPQYGKVWRPDVDQEEFRPYYTRGHWEMTKYGNTWVSDYEWGWAPFHYGRWHHHSRRGWLWIPGREWGPAWVSWRSGGGHYGWAPLGPGLNINISIGRIPDFYWVFVPQRHIYYRSYPKYDRFRNVNIYHNTTIINNVYVYNNRNRYYTGPRAEEIRRITRQPVIINDVRNPRPSRYAGTSNRPEVINRGPERSGNTGVRPDRSVVRPENNGVNPGRSGVTTDSRAERTATRPGENRIPASSQRTERTYDNQDARREQAARGQRESITERSAPAASRSSAPQREQRAERPQQREVSRDNSRQSESRNSSSQSRSSERSGGGSRPSRAQ